MAMRSSKGVSVWVFALLATIIASLFVLKGQDIFTVKTRGVRFPKRTEVVETVETPIAKPKIASERGTLETMTESELVARTDLKPFRTPAPTSLAMLEPTSGVRITAPIARETSNPFETGMPASILANKTLGVAGAVVSGTTVPGITVSSQTPADPQAKQSDSLRDPLFERPGATATAQNNRNWPLASSLLTQCLSLGELSKQSPLVGLGNWTQEVHDLFEALAREPIGSDRSGELLQQARELSAFGFAWAESNLESSTQPALAVSRVSHGIQRRAIVWDRIHQCLKSDSTKSNSERFVSTRGSGLDYERLTEDLAVVREALRGTSDAANWVEFLMLEDLGRLASGGLTTQDQQVQVAQEFLGRLTFSRVTEDQKRVLTSREIQKLAEDVRPLTVNPVDYRKLLLDIESIEETSVHRCCEDVAEAIQSLRFADSQAQYAIANALNQQYRNANIRLSISEEFFNRMMPKDQVTTRAVQQKILGADTQGSSKIQTSLRVDLQPDATGWKVALNLDGDIHSNTRSSRSGATFYNSSNAKVQSVREIRVDPVSLSINGQPASVQSQESLRKFSTNWDQLPIVGDMVRYVAKQEFNEKKPIAKRISQRLIAKQTDDEFNKQLQSNIDRAQEQFDKRLIGPLHTLDLQPMILDMQSTESRLIARYRVAGVNQIAAYTPRPLAPSESLLSLQLHQSAINNLIAQAIPTDRDWTIRELADKIAEILQQPAFELPDDTPEDVNIRFMDVHPMTVEFLDGRMWLTLRIASLEQTGRIQLKNFTVKTSYIPAVEGLRATLERDPLISVDGHRLGSKDRFPIRAIFTKVFAGNSAVPMVSESLINNPLAQGMQVSQLQMEQGWLAIAVSDSQQEVQPSLPPIVDPIATGLPGQLKR